MNNFINIHPSLSVPFQSGEAKIKHIHVILHKQTGKPYDGIYPCTVGLIYYWKKQLCLDKNQKYN
jgi:hypothetical protein